MAERRKPIRNRRRWFANDACREGDDPEGHHDILVKLHQTKQRVTEGLEELRYNTSIAALMQLVNALRADDVCHKFVRAVG